LSRKSFHQKQTFLDKNLAVIANGLDIGTGWQYPDSSLILQVRRIMPDEKAAFLASKDFLDLPVFSVTCFVQKVGVQGEVRCSDKLAEKKSFENSTSI
jgi:hypothetical protein